MKRFVYLASLVLLASIAVARTSILTLHRTFKADQKDAFQMLMAEHLDNFDADVESTWTETVTSVTAAGGADAKLESTSFRVSANGTDIPQAQGPATRTIHFGPGGRLEGSAVDEDSVSRLLPDLFASYAMDRPLDTSKEVKIDDKSVTGTVALVDVADGVAKVKLKLQFSTAGEQKPMRVEATASFDVADSKLESIEGTIRDLPSRMTSRYAIDSANFKVKRLP